MNADKRGFDRALDSSRESIDRPCLFVVMPAYNEAESIAGVLANVREHAPAATLVVVDDGSDDDTIEIARAAGARVLPLCNHLGAWGATQAGIRYALLHGAQTVVTMDSDGQHRAEDIARLLEPLDAQLADVAIGTCTSRGSRMRRFAWRLLRASSGIRV